MIDYHHIIALLSDSEQAREGQEKLYEALEKDIGKHLWNKYRNTAHFNEIIPSEDDTASWCFEWIMSSALFLPSFLKVRHYPRAYLIKSLETEIQREIHPKNPATYYRRELDNFLKNSSYYSRCAGDSYALSQYKNKDVFSGDVNQLFDGEIRGKSSRITKEDMRSLVDSVLERAEAPVSFRDIWEVAKESFQLWGIKYNEFDDIIEFSPYWIEHQINEDNPIHGQETDPLLINNELLQLINEFIDRLDETQLQSLICFAREYRKRIEELDPTKKQLDWESIKECMQVLSGQTARNRIYSQKRSVLQICVHYLAQHGYTGGEYFLSVLPHLVERILESRI